MLIAKVRNVLLLDLGTKYLSGDVKLALVGYSKYQMNNSGVFWVPRGDASLPSCLSINLIQVPNKLYISVL